MTNPIMRYIASAIILIGFAALGSVTAAASERVVYSFLGGADGAGPAGGLVSGRAGSFFGTTKFHGILGCANPAEGCGTVFQVTASGTHTVIYTFGGPPDGYAPLGNLATGKSGALYGTTQYGGTGACAGTDYIGCGTIYKLIPPPAGGTQWTEKVLYNFCSLAACADGAFPSAGLIRGAQGALYGTVNSGGGPDGGGTVFELTPPSTPGGTWQLTILYQFCTQPSCADGSSPNSGLTFDQSGNLYGTTSFGGANGQGVVFELSPPPSGTGLWSETILYSFCAQAGCTDGQAPVAGVVFDAKGALYGTATAGGVDGSGVVYRLAQRAGSWHYAVLHALNGTTNGNFPQSDLIFNPSGIMYGTASFGGSTACQSGCGTLFTLTPPTPPQRRWHFAVLHTFDANGAGTDGTEPQGDLIFSKSGVVLGVTGSGGNRSFGAVYKVMP